MSHQQQEPPAPPPHIPPPPGHPLAHNQQHWQNQGMPYGGTYAQPQAQMPGPFPGAPGAAPRLVPMMPPPLARSLAPPPPPLLPSTSASAAPAPASVAAPAWTEHRAPDGRPYWACPATGQRSWSRPAGLGGASALEAKAEALAESRTRWRRYSRPSDGRLYYSHLDSRATSWSVPGELAEAREAARREVEMEEVAARAKGAAAAALAAASAAAAVAAPAAAAGAAPPAVFASGTYPAAAAAAATATATKEAEPAKNAAAASAAPPPLPGAAEAAKRLARRRAEGRDHMYDTKAEAVEAFFALLSGVSLGRRESMPIFFCFRVESSEEEDRTEKKKKTHSPLRLLQKKQKKYPQSRGMHRLDPLGAGQRAQLHGEARPALGSPAVRRGAQGGVRRLGVAQEAARERGSGGSARCRGGGGGGGSGGEVAGAAEGAQREEGRAGSGKGSGASVGPFPCSFFAAPPPSPEPCDRRFRLSLLQGSERRRPFLRGCVGSVELAARRGGQAARDRAVEGGRRRRGVE